MDRGSGTGYAGGERGDAEVSDQEPPSPAEQQVKLCSEGKYIGAAYGDDLVWVGWEAVDALNRVFEDPDAELPDQNTVWVMLTKEACPASGNFSGDNPVDFKAKFRELWGVG